MDTEITPEIDPFQVRRPRRRSTRPLKVVASAVALGLVFAVGGGGTYFLLGEKEPSRLPAEKLASIKVGPVEEMPEIRDGVPALAAKPIRVIGTAPAQGQGLPTAPKAVESPARTASIEPSIDAILNPAPTIAPKPVAPAAKPVPVAVKPVETKPVAVGATGTDQTAAIAAPPLPPRAERSAAAAPVAPVPAKPAAAPVQAANAGQVLRAPAGAAPAPRQAAAPAPTAAAAPAQVAATEEDEVRVFGVPVPGGRQIRRAAENFADAVTGLPEKF